MTNHNRCIAEVGGSGRDAQGVPSDLTDDERARLEALTSRGTASARRITRAHVLRADAGLNDEVIATGLGIWPSTVDR